MWFLDQTRTTPCIHIFLLLYTTLKSFIIVILNYVAVITLVRRTEVQRFSYFLVFGLGFSLLFCFVGGFLSQKYKFCYISSFTETYISQGFSFLTLHILCFALFCKTQKQQWTKVTTKSSQLLLQMKMQLKEGKLNKI